MTSRRVWLAFALVVTLAAAFWPLHEDGSGDRAVVEAVSKPARPAQAIAETPDTGNARQEETGTDERFAAKAAGNLFPHQTWQPPPPPPPKAQPLPPPPPPEPPPLPFSYLGRWAEGGKETVFLAQGDRVYPAHTGDVLANSWRLDTVGPNQLQFTYLPMDRTQTMRIAP